MKTITYEEYKDALAGRVGWCSDCKEFVDVTVYECDADDYKCCECGERSVMHAEQAQVCMEFEVEDVPDVSSTELMKDLMGI